MQTDREVLVMTAPTSSLREAIKGGLRAKVRELSATKAWTIEDNLDAGYDGLADAALAAIEAQGHQVISVTPTPLEDWHEDMGMQLWWMFPIAEPPYVGSPLCTDWPGYHTHFTPIPLAARPRPQP